jgi:hypothetical protein
MFIDDFEKVRDLLVMSKSDFLASYSYLTEKEYDDTVQYILNHFFEFQPDALLYHGEKPDEEDERWALWYTLFDGEPGRFVYDKELEYTTDQRFLKIDDNGNFVYGPPLDECEWENI